MTILFFCSLFILIASTNNKRTLVIKVISSDYLRGVKSGDFDKFLSKRGAPFKKIVREIVRGRNVL